MAPLISSYEVSIALANLELAKGHDSWLSRKVEPVIMIGCYAVTHSHIRPLGRCLTRFQSSKKYPQTLLPTDPQSSRVLAHLSTDSTLSLAILCLALEEDGGEDVQSLYGMLDNPSALGVLRAPAEGASPLQELASLGSDWLYPRPVSLVVDGYEASSNCVSDKWIGASAWVLRGDALSSAADSRVHVQSEDGLNDWTALIAVRCRPLTNPA